MNRAKPKDLRAMAVMAQTFTKHGVLFVPMPVSDEADFQLLQDQAWKKLEDMELAATTEHSS